MSLQAAKFFSGLWVALGRCGDSLQNQRGSCAPAPSSLVCDEKKGEASCQKSTCFDRRQYSVFRWEKLDWKELLMLCSTFVVYSKNWSISLPSCFFCRIVLHVFAMDLANRIGKVFGKRPLCDANAFFKAGSISSNEKIAETSKLCDFRHTSCTSHTLRNECSTPTFRDKQLINRSTPKKSPLYRQQNRNFTKIQVKQLKRWKKNKVQGFIQKNSVQKQVEIHFFSHKKSPEMGPFRLRWSHQSRDGFLGPESWGWIGGEVGMASYRHTWRLFWNRANRNTTKNGKSSFSMQLDRSKFWYSSKSKSQNEAYFKTVDWVWLSLEKHALKRRILSLRGVPEDKECMTTKGVVLRVCKSELHLLRTSRDDPRKPRQTFVADGTSPLEKHIILKPGPKQDCLTGTFFHDEFQRYENKQFEQSKKAHLNEIQEEAVHSDHNVFVFCNLLPKAIRPLAIKSCLITRPCSFGEHTHTLYREKKFSYLCIYIYIYTHNYT